MYFFTTLSFFVSVLSIMAGVCFGEDMVVDCTITPAIWAEQAPPAFVTSNNLRRLTGAYKFAKGPFVNIVGRVLDSNCTPVEGVVVRIWQANALGVFNGDPQSVDNNDENFAGSGTTVTDNLGRYAFFTVMPGAYQRRAPHIKFSLYHQELGLLETEMFFPDQYLTQKDRIFKRQINDKNRKLLLAKRTGYDSIEDADIYEFDITLEGDLNYKQH